MGFGGVLKKMFPFIAQAATLGGPLGVMAANAIGSKLGVANLEPDGIEAAITSAQKQDPEVLLKLQETEQAFKLQMAQLGFDNLEAMAAIDAGDRASARAREIAIKDKIPAILAITVTGGFFGLLYLMAFHRVPAESQTILNVLIGSLGSAFIGIVNYYFGSSAGSKAKTDLMAK